MTLGTNIRKFRNEKNMTQKDLADELHCTPQAVSRWEADEVEPSIDTLKQMATLFGCSMDDLFGLESKKETIIVKEPEVVEKVVYTEAQPVLGVCDGCGKMIKDLKDYFKVDKRVRVGRGSTVKTVIYCANCKKKDDEEQARIKAEAEAEKRKEFETRRVHSFIWPTLLGIIFIVIGIIGFAQGNTSFGVSGMICGIFAYLLVATLILDNTFVSDVFTSVAGFGFVKMPGVIFSLSFNGIIFLIVTKIILFLISVSIGVFFAIFGTILSALLSVIGYPLALYRNFHYIDI
jgi:transcriptional regulator with XRE-family HTH domain